MTALADLGNRDMLPRNLAILRVNGQTVGRPACDVDPVAVRPDHNREVALRIGDAILPQLMPGKLRVKDAAALVAAAV